MISLLQSIEKSNALDDSREIPGCDGYRITPDGDVYSCWKTTGRGRGKGVCAYISDTWRKLAVFVSRGYKTVRVANKTYAVHRLVLLAFVGPCPDGCVACHGDSNQLNNHFSNLRWDTPAANTNDIRELGRIPGGERHHLAKLTNAQIDEIRALGANLSGAEIARRFNVSASTISLILNNKRRTPSSHAGKGNSHVA